MAEVEEQQTEAVEAEEQPEKKPKKSRKSAKTKEDGDGGEEKEEKPKPKRYVTDNPSIHDQITEALDVLEDRKGVTLVAIKRYLEDNYHVDMTKTAHRVRKVLLKAVEDGDVIRTRGTGCAGRFKVKHTKPTMIKKRQPPTDYQQLPYGTRESKPRKEPKETPSKAAKATPKKKETPKAKKGKKGKAGKKRK